MKGKRNEKWKKDMASASAVTADGTEDAFYRNRKTVRELIAPSGINPNPLDYMELDDNGVKLYTMCFYVDKIPKKLKFAYTFAPLFNFPEITSNVFIEPISRGKSSKKLNKRVISLDTERIAALNAGDRNRVRDIGNKLRDAEHFAEEIEGGDNALFEVSFLFTMQAVDLDRLRLIANDFNSRAREKGLELASCYSVHPEAFVSGYPTNRVFKAQHGLVTSNVIKRHIFDKYALNTIFNHTRSSFYHKNGILAGRNLNTRQLVPYDVYDESHTQGYNVAISGVTGTGKSATIKMWLSRYIDFGYKIRSVDMENKGSRGEYSIMADAVGGVNYQIRQNSDHIINPFELDVSIEMDEITKKEIETLNVSEKVTDVVSNLMIMIKGEKTIEQFDDAVSFERIVTDIVSGLYEEFGIMDGRVDSLYTSESQVMRGRFFSGKVKKNLPTISDFYKKIIMLKRSNKEKAYDRACRLIRDAMKDYVKELYYCEECLAFYARDDYERLEVSENERKCTCGKCSVLKVKGVRSYYDGQSTIRLDKATPHFNIDLSLLPEKEKPVAMTVAMNFLKENCVKKNSLNPKHAEKMILLFDEVQKAFVFPNAREFIVDQYATARKRNVSVWSATQALSNYHMYEETKTLLKNTATVVMLKQDTMDRKFLQENTVLTDAQVETVLSLGGEKSDTEERYERQGELCLIDNNSKVVFLKVDYLKDSEKTIVETDIGKVKEMYG